MQSDPFIDEMINLHSRVNYQPDIGSFVGKDRQDLSIHREGLAKAAFHLCWCSRDRLSLRTRCSLLVTLEYGLVLTRDRILKCEGSSERGSRHWRDRFVCRR